MPLGVYDFIKIRSDGGGRPFPMGGDEAAGGGAEMLTVALCIDKEATVGAVTMVSMIVGDDC